MIDVLLISAPFPAAPLTTRFREHLANAVASAWREIPSVRILQSRLHPPERWLYAERLTHERFYILADDDCLPHPKLDIQRVVNTMILRPEYGMIGLHNVVTPYQGRVDEDGIIEAHALGGVRFIRRGVVTEFPDSFNGDDSAYWDLMHARGYRQGVATGETFGFVHCGEWRSTWPLRPSSI